MIFTLEVKGLNASDTIAMDSTHLNASDTIAMDSTHLIM
jgi:hypothetical protein